MQQEQNDKIAAEKSMGTDRSERIRTYNSPQSRIMDHRNQPDSVQAWLFDGDLDEVIDALITEDQARRWEI